MPTDFIFMRPGWLALLLLIPMVIYWLGFSARRGGNWTQLVAPELRKYVLDGSARTRSRYGLTLLAAISLLLAALAMAGPAWDKTSRSLNRGGSALVVVLDLSRSMDVADLSPSRLDRAKVKLYELLENRNDGETALIVYSANAFTVVPLTNDNDTISTLISSLSTNIMPSRGSYPAAAIRKAGQLLEQASARSGEVLMVADDGYSEAATSAAAQLRSDGHRLSVLGVGTIDGGPVPAPGGGFENNREGKVAVVRLRPAELARIAAAGGGRYQTITADSSDLQNLVLNTTERTQFDEAAGESIEVWNDQGILIVLALLPLAALLFRRGWLMLLLVFVLPATQPVMAFSLEDLWRTPDQQGAKRMEVEDYSAAAELFENEQWQAAALYRKGDFAEASRLLERGASVTDQYNRGNALARSGDLDAAIAAYEQALNLEPDHEDALFNKQLLEEIRNQQQQEQDSQGENSGESGQQDSEQSEGGQQGDPGQEQQQGQQGEQQDGEQQSSAESSGSSDPNSAENSEQESGAGDESDEADVEAMRQAMQKAAQ